MKNTASTAYEMGYQHGWNARTHFIDIYRAYPHFGAEDVAAYKRGFEDGAAGEPSR